MPWQFDTESLHVCDRPGLKPVRLERGFHVVERVTYAESIYAIVRFRRKFSPSRSWTRRSRIEVFSLLYFHLLVQADLPVIIDAVEGQP